jgi:hypothetical protein
MAAAASYALCVHCFEAAWDHAFPGKCLFGPTKLELIELNTHENAQFVELRFDGRSDKEALRTVIQFRQMQTGKATR